MIQGYHFNYSFYLFSAASVIDFVGITTLISGVKSVLAASRSGSRGTSPQTARLNILTSPTVVGSGHQQPLTDTTNSMYTPLSQRSSQQSRIGGPSPTSGVGASQNRRTGIPRSLNASREHSPSSGYGTRSVTGNRSCKLKYLNIAIINIEHCNNIL